ncbi:MAG: hypothetical protein Q8L81_15145 [Bacteroidota bacterium]|nr:hypothetical protein [Bacteroidota bacterium]
MNLIKSLILSLIFIFLSKTSLAQAETPDTVYTGIYITSIHDIDFKQKEFTVNLWLWLKYKNKDFDFVQNLEVPQAKTVVKSFSTIDTTGNKIYIIMKLQCIMKDSWKINSFPFDRQKLRISIENSQYDSKSLIFAEDTLGNHYDPRFTVQGWTIDSFAVSTRIKSYETAFGDDSQPRPHKEYSQFRVKIGLVRDAMGMFWKMFIGMYVAFLIAFSCFFIHADNIDSRFGLSVGALFAVIGNKYVIDSALPESSSFTLVDTLHGITLIFIFSVIASSIYALNLLKHHEINRSNRFDRVASIILLTVYFILNAYYIWDASNT